MRIGQHPLKTDLIKLTHDSFHRVLVPVYIPDLGGYYENLFEVLKLSLSSLFSTISTRFTKVTIINNGSNETVSRYLFELHRQYNFDKLVILNDNRGKLEAVLNEARASTEEFISIVDADILFFKGWESAVFNVFSVFPKATVVSPMPAPQHAFYYNKSCQFDLVVSSNLKWGNVSPHGVTLIEKGFNNFGKFEEYKKGQFYTERNGLKVLLGSGHFCATYKREIFFYNIYKKVDYVFKGGYEADYIDCIADIKGGWRLATEQPYAYHMGNSIPDEAVVEFVEKHNNQFNKEDNKALDKAKIYFKITNNPKWIFKFKKKANYLLSRFVNQLKK